MPDASLTTTIISTAGTLLGALGGIGLTQGTAARREARRPERRRGEERDRVREQAYMDLLGAARQLCLQIEVAARCPWRDMDVRLSAVERQGAEVGRHASRAAPYAPPGVADAGRLVAEEGRRLVGRPVPAVGCAAPRPAAGPRRTRWARWIRRAGSAPDARCAAALGGRRRAQPVRGAGGSDRVRAVTSGFRIIRLYVRCLR